MEEVLVPSGLWNGKWIPGWVPKELLEYIANTDIPFEKMPALASRLQKLTDRKITLWTALGLSRLLQHSN